MKSIFKTAAALFAISVLAGCAHTIRIAPDNASLPPATAAQKAPLVVGYYIADEERQRHVTTAGGGGDKVEYAPYGDLEAGIYRVLNNVFADVRPMKSANDTAAINGGVVLAFRPTITTNSSSDSVLTWPPTDFEVNIEMKAADSSGKVVWSELISGKGHATFSEFKSDFGLSAKRASEAALKQLQARLQATDMASLAGRSGTAVASAAPAAAAQPPAH